MDISENIELSSVAIGQQGSISFSPEDFSSFTGFDVMDKKYRYNDKNNLAVSLASAIWLPDQFPMYIAWDNGKLFKVPVCDKRNYNYITEQSMLTLKPYHQQKGIFVGEGSIQNSSFCTEWFALQLKQRM